MIPNVQLIKILDVQYNSGLPEPEPPFLAEAVFLVQLRLLLLLLLTGL